MIVDRYVRLSNELRRAQTHASDSSAARESHEQNLVRVSAFIAGAVEEGDIDPAVDTGLLLESLNSGVLGVLLAADSRGESPFAGLAGMWRVWLPGVVVEGSLPFFARLVDSMERHYRD